MAEININGKTFSVSNGASITVRNNRVVVGGKDITDSVTISDGVLRIEVAGPLLNLETDASVTCGAVQGNVSAGGSINCDNIEGNVTAGGSVNCGNIGGSATAGGSINY